MFACKDYSAFLHTSYTSLCHSGVGAIGICRPEKSNDNPLKTAQERLNIGPNNRIARGRWRIGRLRPDSASFAIVEGLGRVRAVAAHQVSYSGTSSDPDCRRRHWIDALRYVVLHQLDRQQ